LIGGDSTHGLIDGPLWIKHLAKWLFISEAAPESRQRELTTSKTSTAMHQELPNCVEAIEDVNDDGEDVAAGYVTTSEDIEMNHHSIDRPLPADCIFGD
jgi:hypothetical protein